MHYNPDAVDFPKKIVGALYVYFSGVCVCLLHDTPVSFTCVCVCTYHLYPLQLFALHELAYWCLIISTAGVQCVITAFTAQLWLLGLFVFQQWSFVFFILAFHLLKIIPCSRCSARTQQVAEPLNNTFSHKDMEGLLPQQVSLLCCKQEHLVSSSSRTSFVERLAYHVVGSSWHVPFFYCWPTGQ